MKAYLKMFKNYVNFGGYTSRADFWQAFIVNIIVYSTLLTTIILSGHFHDNLKEILKVYNLLTILPIVGMIIRRLRDAGKSALNVLWALLPIIGQIVLLVKLVQPSVNKK